MGQDLFGKQVLNTYDAIIKVGDNDTLTGIAKQLSDGRGNDAPIWLSTARMGIGITPDTNYTLTVNGAAKIGSLDVTGAVTAASVRLTGGSGSQGLMSWNTDEETVDIVQNGATLQVGQEIQVHVKNQTGSLISDGTPVYVTGTLGSSGRLTVAPMIADGTIEAKYFLGVTTEDIPNGEDGKVTTFGKIRGLNTDAYTEGTTLYVSAATAGAWQTTPPAAPNLDLEVAIVINKSVNNGTIFVRAQQGHYLGLLHDVYINNPTNSQVLNYNTANSRWENTSDLSLGNLTLSGYLRGAANFVIDPAAYGDETGVVQILGDLRVDGTTTTINSTTVTINDKNIVLASGSATAADANGAGITIDGASATITYYSTQDAFQFNKKINVVTNNVGIVTSYGRFSVEATDAQLDIISSSDGSWGSAINFVEGTDSTANTDIWSIARQTTGGSGDSSLRFNYGTTNSHNNTTQVTFTSAGDIIATNDINAVGAIFSDSVAIGQTAAPSQALHVNGNIIVGGQTHGFVHGGGRLAVSADGDVIIVTDSNDTAGATPDGKIVFGGGSLVDTNADQSFSFSDAFDEGLPRNEWARIIEGKMGIGETDPDTKLHITEEGAAPVLLTLQNTQVSGDIANDGTTGNFIDFISTDANANFTPQVRIGMVVQDYSGDNGISTEGNGNFIVYTGQGTDELGAGTLTESFRVRSDYDVDVVAGGLRIGGTTVIDSSRNIKLADGVEFRAGTDNDTRFYHSGTHPYFDNYTGSIFIRNFADGQDIVLASDDGSGGLDTYLRVDGSEGSVILYHYGQPKLETTSSGVSITGTLNGDITTSSISGGTIDIDASTAINLKYNGSTQLRVDTFGVAYLGTVTFANDGISLTDEDSTTDSFFHANVDYDAGLYQVTSNARYGADYIQVDGQDSRSGNDRVFVISPKDIGSPDEDAILYLGGDNSITAPNTLMDWHTIEMNALSVQINNAEVATRTWVTSNTTLQDVTDRGNSTTQPITIADNAESFTALTLETSSTTYVKQDFKTDTLAASKAYIIAYGSTNPQDGAFAIKNNANHTTTNGTAGDIWFETNGSERLRIKGSDGTVNINNDLDVAGTTYTEDIIVDFDASNLSHGIIFRGVAASAGEVGIRANGEAFEIYEPEQSNKVWLSIADDPEGNGIAAQLNSPSGFTPILTNYNKGDYITKSYIDGLNVDADTFDGLNSTEFLRSNTADTFSGGTLTISSTAPILDFVDTNSFTDTNDRFRIRAAGDVGQIRWYDDSAATDTVLTTFYPNGNVSIAGELSLGGAVINMANDDGFVYDDANNVMKVKYDGNQYDILTAANHTSFTDPKYLRSDQDDTTTGTLTIQKSLLDATFLNLLNQNTGGDISQQRSFIDFTYVDSNTNETPQVRIGAEVGQNGDADSQIKEGSGAFIVYTNNADTDAGIAGASLAERFRVDYAGRVGINNNSPFAKLQITGAAQGNGHYDDFATVLAEDNECRFQLLSTNDGNDASTILLTNVQSSTDNRHWVIGHRGPSRSNRFEIGYVTSTTGGNIGTGGFADFVIDTSGRVGINIDTPTEQFEVNGDVRIYGSGSTIGGATVGNASLLIGSPTLGIGIDDNEIHSTGAMYIGTNSSNLVLRPADAVLINTTTTTGSAKLLVNGFLSSGSSAIAQFKGFIRAEGQLFLHHDSNNSNAARILYDGTNGLSFTTEGTGSNNFGIGTTTPEGRLDVRPNASCNYVFTGTSTSGYTTTFNMDDTGLDIGHNSTGRSLNLKTGSSDRLTITGAGLVGINDTSPSYTLDVNGSIRIGGVGNSLLFDTTGAGASNGIRTINNYETVLYNGRGNAGFAVIGNADIRLGFGTNYDGAQTDLMIKPTGFIGMGCSDPQTALEIRGNAPYLTISNLTENDAGIYFNDYQAGADPSSSSQSAAIKWSSSDNKFRIFNNDAANLAMTIDMDNRIGIGTDSPQAPLHIIAATSANSALIQEWSYTETTTDQYSLMLKQTVTSGVVRYNFSMVNNNTTYNDVIVLDRGKVGFGTTDPSAKIHIVDDTPLKIHTSSNGVGAKINFSDMTSGYTQNGTMEYVHSDTQSYGSGNAFKFYGTEASMSFHVAGKGLFTGDVTAFYSDMRLKTKLGDIENPIEKIQALSGFYYEPNEVAQSYGYEKERRLGLSAQEVKEVFPEAVSDAAIGDGYMSVDYAKLVPVLVEAIKEQQKQIDELKARLDA